MKKKRNIDPYVSAIIAVSCLATFLAMLLMHGDAPPWLTFVFGIIISRYLLEM